MPEKHQITASRDKMRIVTAMFVFSATAVIAMWPGIYAGKLLSFAGIAMIVLLSFVCFYFFIYYFRREVLQVIRKTLFLLLSIVAFFTITRIVTDTFESVYVYMVPFSLIAIVVRIFYGARLAIFTFLIAVLLAGFIVPESFEFVFINLMSGFAAVFSLSDINRKGRVFFSAIVVVVSCIVVYTAVNAAGFVEGTGIERDAYFSFVMNGLVILLAYPLIFLFEKRFYFLSDTTLLELCDTNQPLLRRLAEKAPGSYHHSLQVANLAEDAARALGANILMAKAGALYHDIGKIGNAGFFIENHPGGKNPHDDMDPLKSAIMIIGHVHEGVKLGRTYGLPVQILDFIRTHHGTTKAYYFYKKYLESSKNANDSGESFIYPGPRPFTREMAIVMMADAVEAASHTLDNYTDFNISELVERILIIQEQDDQFSEAPVTYKDLTIIRRVFKKGLANIYHARIAYPDREEINS